MVFGMGLEHRQLILLDSLLQEIVSEKFIDRFIGDLQVVFVECWLVVLHGPRTQAKGSRLLTHTRSSRRSIPAQTVIVVTMRNLIVISSILLSSSSLVRTKSVSKSGLQVEVTKEVKCKETHKAVNGDKVTVHYGGFLQDGKKFDSSFDRQQPFTFTIGVGQVIPGWDQGLLGVCKGEERHLVVPSSLAYGDRGAGDVIPPDATLLFDIVVVDVVKAKSAEDLRRKQEEDERRRQQELEAQRAQQQKEQQQQPDYEYEDYPAASGSACPAGRLDTRVQYQPPDCSRKARKGDKLRMHYVGKLLDGTKFDSSIDRNKPFDFTLGVGQVIQGWDAGVAGMCVSEKRTLVVPPDMAYGEAGVGNVIPSCATLVFDVLLLSIDS